MLLHSSTPPTAHVTVLVPAHDEQDRVGATIASLRGQTLRPDRIVVVSDNSTDDTVAVARAAGAEVIETVGNEHRKAGALNQALRALRPTGYVLVMDADTVLSDVWVRTAVGILDTDPEVGAVGAVFHAERSDSLLTRLQANEYTRYAREIDRSGRVMVLSGTAAMIRPEALRHVALARGTSLLPGTNGDVYDVHALTEDNELTLALKTMGYRLESPAECSTVTEVMPTWGDLCRQRLRWYRGALENLRSYGLTPVTARYWGQQLMLTIGVAALWGYLLLLLVSLVAGYPIGWSWFGLAIGAVFAAERVVTVWPAGRRARIIAAALYVELLYELVLQLVFVRAVADVITRRTATWHHAVTTPKGI